MKPNIDLNQLKVFEAAARHGSFTRAAEELNISQPAVSQRVRMLEGQLGTALFLRGARSLQLTEDGERLARVTADAMGLLTDGLVRAASNEPQGIFRISCLPAFATCWLARRIHTFAHAYPKLNVHLSSEPKNVDFRAVDIDVGIRWGVGPWDHTRSTLLYRERYIAVCAPKIAPEMKSKDQDKFILLDASGSEKLLDIWLSEAGVDCGLKNRTIHYETSADLIEAAMAGAGVALVRKGLVTEALSMGRLTQPWNHELQGQSGYHLVCAKSRYADPKVIAFRTWITNEVSSVGAAPEL